MIRVVNQSDHKRIVRIRDSVEQLLGHLALRPQSDQLKVRLETQLPGRDGRTGLPGRDDPDTSLQAA